MKKAIVTLLVILSAILFFALWYNYQYSMDEANAFEVNQPSEPNKILIATQGSEYKDELVANLIDSLRPRQLYIKVVDVSALPNVSVASWNAIVIIHTWEMSKPPEQVQSFLGENEKSKKLIICTTSGDGNETIDGIDGITGESDPTNLSERTREILKRIDKLIQTNQ